MSLVKPIALAVNAFDATQPQTLYFNSTGGDQVVKNKLTVRNNVTSVVVYENTIESFLFQQEVPASTLTNDVYYNYYFNTYNVSDDMSPNSNSVPFYCYTQPTIVFTNTPTTNVIESASYTFDVTYDQSEGELLNSLIYRLYDSSGVEIPPNSGNLYSALTPPLTFSHTFDGFENNTSYKVQVSAVSVNGTETLSELYSFSTDYIPPNMFQLLVVENKCDDGYEQINSNIVISDGVVDPEPALFRSDVIVDEVPISKIQNYTLLSNPYFGNGIISWNVTRGGLTESKNIATLLATATDGYIYQYIVGKNLLQNKAVTTTISGVTFAVNSDKSITCTGTATSLIELKIGDVLLNSGEYSCSRSFSDGEESKRKYILYKVINGVKVFFKNIYDTDVQFTVTEKTIFSLYVYVYSGYSVNETIYPQIELGLSSTSYEQYGYSTAYQSHIMYISSYIKSTSSQISLLLNDGVTTSSLAHSGSGNYERLSLTHTEDISATDTIFEIHDYRTSAWDNVYIRDCICIDLTAIYGSGNEPSKATIDSMIDRSFRCIQWDVWFEPVDNVISVWADRYSLEMTDQSKTLTFNDGFSIQTGFQFQMWMYPSEDGIIGYLYKLGNESNRMIIEMKSGIPSTESTVKNWFELYTEDGNLVDYSNYVDEMNTDTRFIIWFKKVGTTYNLLLDVLMAGTEPTIAWDGTATYPSAKVHNNIDSLFPFDTIILRNGVFDNLDITSNTDRAYSRLFPIWDYYTKLNCDFSDLRGGNIDLVLSQVSSIRVKRRLNGTFNWITLYDIPIVTANDLNVSKIDSIVPTSKIFDYAIVPVMSGGEEGEYIIQSVNTMFRWCYLCDENTILKFYSNVAYPSISSNPVAGLLVPIGREFPITIYNSDSDYETGSFSGNILGGNFLTTRKINRADVQSQLETYKAFINNKRPKVLKDWDGRIKIVDTNVNSGLIENVDLVNGKANLSFQWVEKGNYNNQNDLYYNGLIDVLS